MKVQFTIIIAVGTLLVGALLGYFVPQLITKAPQSVAKAPEPGAKEEQAGGKRPARTRSQSTHEADLNRLRARINKLEQEKGDLMKQLAQRDAPPAAEPVDGAQTNRVDRLPPFGRPPSVAEMRARFEEMREKDPERYNQMTNNMAQWRARRQERLQNQFDILASADTRHMTKAQRKVHEDYQNLLARQEELHELMNPNNTDATDEQREAAFKEMREIRHQLHDLQRTERDTLLTQTANALGYKGNDAKEVVNAIKEVYEATGGGHHGPPPGGPGGPGGGRRGRR